MPCNLERTIIDNLVICYLAPTELLGWLKQTDNSCYGDFRMYRAEGRFHRHYFHLFTDDYKRLGDIYFERYASKGNELYLWLKVENSLLHDQSYLEVIDQLSVLWELEFNGFTSLDLARDFGYDVAARIRKMMRREDLAVMVNEKEVRDRDKTLKQEDQAGDDGHRQQRRQDDAPSQAVGNGTELLFHHLEGTSFPAIAQTGVHSFQPTADWPRFGPKSGPPLTSMPGVGPKNTLIGASHTQAEDSSVKSYDDPKIAVFCQRCLTRPVISSRVKSPEKTMTPYFGPSREHRITTLAPSCVPWCIVTALPSSSSCISSA